jgi:hypothetical protein
MLLPQVQADPADKIKFADSLEDECYRDPNRAVWQLNKQRWLDLYTGNHFADPLVSTGIAVQSLEPEQVNRAKRASEVCKLVYNRVMNAVLAMLAGQVANPPKVVFSARESGEPPIYYLNGFVQNPALTQIAAMAGAADADAQQMAKFFGPDHPDAVGAAAQAGQSVPLPPELVQQVQMLIDQGKMATMQARMAGMPPPRNIVPPEALVEITDQTTAQFTQTIFDALWEQCGGVEATAENVLNKKVLGWQPTLFEYDRTKIEYGPRRGSCWNSSSKRSTRRPTTPTCSRARRRPVHRAVGGEPSGRGESGGAGHEPGDRSVAQAGRAAVRPLHHQRDDRAGRAEVHQQVPAGDLEAFKRRQKALYLDISVEIQSGSAAAKQGQTQSLVAAKQAG